MKKAFQLTICLFFILGFHRLSAQEINPLQQEIQSIVKGKQATVGIAISDFKGQHPVYWNKNKHFVMQSVFKLPIALYVLHLVDQGKWSLQQPINISRDDLHPNTWSPIREKFPNGTTMPLSKLIAYTVAWSDNNGCDILLRMVDGHDQVEQYLHQKGIKDVSIKVNEATMHKNEKAQYKNWITPQAANKLLRLFYFNEDQLLKDETHTFIWDILRGTQTGVKKLRGQLPKAVIVAHKTGSSGQNESGITAAENDIGVIFLPNGNPLFVSVFVTASKETPDTNKQIIAEVAKAAWKFYK